MTPRHSFLALVLTGLMSCAPEPARESESETAGAESGPGLENGSFMADLNGFPIHYEVHGRGPVLMTVPNSWGLTHEGLRALFRELEEHFTLVYFDPRGMGGSGPIREPADMGKAAMREDFDALREHLGLDRVNAIGWSNGAMNLLILAAERPEIVSAAVFLHGTARFGQQDMQVFAERYPDLFEAYTEFQKEMESPELSAEQRNARLKELDLEIWFPKMFADPEAAGPILAEAFENAGFSWRHNEHAMTDPPTPFDVRDDLGRITAPSLVIAGRHDMMPPARAKEIHDGIADSEFVVFEESGHFAPLEEPERFVTTVREFLEMSSGT